MPIRPGLLALVGGALGGAVAIAAMELFSTRSEFPLFFIPFATSIVLVMGTPDAEPSQPRALVGGHIIATLVGLVVVKLTGPDPWIAALAVGVAIAAMQITDTFHPPAGINPLLVVVNDMSWGFLAVPVGSGALLLAGFAFLWINFVHRQPWPRRWL
jgi:CBS-domain-containing membrane protein